MPAKGHKRARKNAGRFHAGNHGCDSWTGRFVLSCPFVGQGSGNEALALKLGISAQAVEEHRDSLIKKTGLLSQAELTTLGVQLGLIQAGDFS